MTDSPLDLTRRALDRAHALAEQWQGDQTRITRAHASSVLMEAIQLHGWTQTTVAPGRHLAPVTDGAARQATGQADTTPDAAVVAYRSIYAPNLLFCRAHNRGWPGFIPLTSEDLPDGGICTWGPNAGPKCGRDVLIDEPLPAPVVGQPAAAPDTDEAHPTRTQWVIEWYRAAKDQWIEDQPAYNHREDAVDEITRQRRHQPARKLRLVRETTTWTVEDETR